MAHLCARYLKAMMVSSDQQLLARIAERDSAAFAEFYDRHASRVLGLLVRLLPSREDADDVLQEVYWQVWRSAPKYDPDRGSPQVWLFMMARSRAMDSLRRHRPTSSAEQPETESATRELPDTVCERSETAEFVQKHLDQLPVEQRTAICLSFYNGLTHKEIARQLDVPLGTAKTRIRRGITQIRRSLSGTLDDRSRIVEEAMP